MADDGRALREGRPVRSSLPPAAQRQHYLGEEPRPAAALLLPRREVRAAAAGARRRAAVIVLRCRVFQDRVRRELAVADVLDQQIRAVHSEILEVGEGEIRRVEPE